MTITEEQINQLHIHIKAIQAGESDNPTPEERAATDEFITTLCMDRFEKFFYRDDMLVEEWKAHLKTMPLIISTHFTVWLEKYDKNK